MHNLAEMFDYVSIDCGMELDEFFSMFLTNGLAQGALKKSGNI